MPNEDELIAFIREAGQTVSKRDIARHFGLRGNDKIPLKKMLRDLSDRGVLAQDQARSFRPADSLPAVAVLEFDRLDKDGEIILRPTNVEEVGGEKPHIRLDRKSKRHEAMGSGDRVLARLVRVSTDRQVYRASVIKRLQSNPESVLGIYRGSADGGRVVPVDKRAKMDYFVMLGDTNGASDGDLVLADPSGKPGRKALRATARVREVLGDINAPKSISLIAIHQHDIPTAFPDEAIKEAERATAPSLEGRTDLRRVPLITIDPPDARDHDDAVFAEHDEDPNNPGGFHAIVAIADVSHFVRAGSALDREARRRGNSCYFPDRVVPMLPESLSNGLCSLKPGEDRAALVCHMWFDASGEKIRHRFERALINSHANIPYHRVQAALTDAPDAKDDQEAQGLLDTVLRPLKACFDAMMDARARREPLELEVAERQIIMDDMGVVTAIKIRERYDAHKIIEEMMIAANVAAAEQLEAKQTPLLYRTHEEPPMAKLEALRDFLQGEDLKLAKGAVMMPRLFNGILRQVKGETREPLINEVILRSQTQAYYGSERVGHFGLALARYAHFTSPIRRYADLIVHRGLVKAMKLGDGGLGDEEVRELDNIGQHISETERRAMSAERQSKDRYVASFLSNRVGETFHATVSGVTRFGLFLSLEPSGADALLPMNGLGDDFFEHDETHHRLVGKRTGMVYRLGDKVEVVLDEADKITGGIKVSLEGVEPSGFSGRRRNRRINGKAGAKSGSNTRSGNRSSGAPGGRPGGRNGSGRSSGRGSPKKRR